MRGLVVLDIPKDYKVANVTAKSPKSSIRFNTISEEDHSTVQVERRLSPTRRRSDADTDENVSAIDRRTSSDRRKPSFSAKA